MVFPELIGTPLQQVFRTVYQTGVPVTSKETHAQIRLKGELQDRYYTYNLVPLRSASGGVYGLWVIVVDITEQVVARKETERLNNELNVAARAKDEFLAMLGHELRNPLAPIVTALQLIRMRTGELTREQLIIDRQVNHLIRLVDDLLDVSRITRGMVELRLEVVSLAQVMQKAVEMAEHVLERKAHHLTVTVQDQTWYGDPARLAQVVANLLTNAARYTPAGGEIALAVASCPPNFTISVTDNGVGIGADLMPHIFDLFVQGSRNSDRAAGGLGIGLSLVKNLVGMHGGAVTAHSDGEGHGSKFTVTLPLRTSAEVPLPALAHLLPDAGTGPGRDILLVDDNKDAADTLAQLLKSNGHRVRVAYEPFEAIESFCAMQPEIAILDIGLPGMDGYHLAERLRQAMPELHCTLFSLSGYGQMQDQQRSVAAGFTRHLVKPVDSHLLLATINSIP
ncbi:MAG: ATP-binding protein [Telluria sp.]